MRWGNSKRSRLGWEGQELSLGPVEFDWPIRYLRGDAEWAIGYESVAQEGSFS